MRWCRSKAGAKGGLRTFVSLRTLVVGGFSNRPTTRRTTPFVLFLPTRLQVYCCLRLSPVVLLSMLNSNAYILLPCVPYRERWRHHGAKYTHVNVEGCLCRYLGGETTLHVHTS